MRDHDLSSLEVLYLAGEPLDEPTAAWVTEALDVPVIDNYWQTESGWPIMAIARALDDRPSRLGSPGVPMYGYNVQLLNEVTGEPCEVNEKGMLVIEGPLPPGCVQTHLGGRCAFCEYLLVSCSHVRCTPLSTRGLATRTAIISSSGALMM